MDQKQQADVIANHIRMLCLQHLNEVRPETLTEPALLEKTRLVYPSMVMSDLLRELHYLGLKGLLTTTNKFSSKELRLTAAGVDCVESQIIGEVEKSHTANKQRVHAVITRCRNGQPLIELEGAMFNGLEIRPSDLRQLAQHLTALSEMASHMPIDGKNFCPTRVVIGDEGEQP